MRVVTGPHNLVDCGTDLEPDVGEIPYAVRNTAADGIPWSAELLAVLVDVGVTRVGQFPKLAAIVCDGAYQALVFELLQCGVDRAGACAPGAVAAVGQLLNQLVPVARLLGEQDQCGGSYVTAPCSVAAAAATAGTERSEGAAEPERSAAAELRTSAAELATARAPARPVSTASAVPVGSVLGGGVCCRIRLSSEEMPVQVSPNRLHGLSLAEPTIVNCLGVSHSCCSDLYQDGSTIYREQWERKRVEALSPTSSCGWLPAGQAKLAAVPAQNTRPRLAELVGVAARACDVGIGLPIEHTIRTCLVSVELGRRIGLSTGDLADLYYLSLLRMLGCTAGSAEAADLFSDEVKFGADTQHLDYGNGQAFGAWVMANFGSDRAPAERQAMIEHLFTLTPERHRESSAGHCEVAQLLARRIGVSSAVVEGLAFAFERFDGTGRPFGVPGPNQPLIARVVALCNEVEVHNRLGGPKAAETMARDRAGGAFDPDLVAAFCADRDAVLAVLEPPALWESWLAAEPGAVHHLDDAQVREAARAIGDFGDLKSHFFAGHATAVAQLADDTAERAGLDKNRRTALQLAALLHDVGRVAVTTAIWDKPAMLSDSEWEKVRLHPYYSERCLARAASLTNVATIVGKHHERLDGSGYHRGGARNGLAKEDRILAAADAFAAMRAVRPHRPPLDLDLAGRELRAMAERDLLDAEAVNCVLAAAGDTRAPVRRTWPAGLTDREVDVLREIAIGSSIQQAAGVLQVSAKTVDFHLQNVYAKAGITTRAAAALFAVQHDLLNA